ncbi:ABC transporter-associated protein EcsC [Bacillus sp. AFS002410]|uniref:EcsC family protein n=1 Tax=Bacillus sp. AFS002410 TaxID=2033481 RepID=UPI000BEF9B35|nr:EcsC family protein [Bacillus sp. AFS002410]PEJ60741.1 ABC transporter-associated protein EcsC [Bacillus sp. AFS002410]
MDSYELRIQYELSRWKQKVMAESNIFQTSAKKVQLKIQSLLPEQIQDLFTKTVKNMMVLFMGGSTVFNGSGEEYEALSLRERDLMLDKKMNEYKKISAVEGAGTGAGGLLLGLADFPLLLGIKIRFLVEAAKIYGYSPKDELERQFMLYIFQLAFSSDNHRKKVFQIIEKWEDKIDENPQVNWEQLQQEYRDHIDLAKLLQLVPVIGAPVGAYVNYQLLEQLGETAKNAYRLRYMNKKEELF